jgi:DNA helicase-2/ATP-dependent DNA helicase PcrA
LIINPNDEEALVRIINYPARGIGDTTMDRLVVKANEMKISLFALMEQIQNIDIQINAPTKAKLSDFVMMIESFNVFMQSNNAFDTAKEVVNRTKIVKDLQGDSTPEDISKIENIEELLNGIQDFIAVQSENEEEDISLSAFLQTVTLSSDLDRKEEGDDDAVTLMTVHMAKGLEFPVVFIAGLEEGLFPSSMNMNTREDLEEERRLFYVALTRAERQAYLMHTQMRFRWGKLTDCEPSRFLVELDEEFLDIKTPLKPEPQQNIFLDADIFGEMDQSKIRFEKPDRKPVEKFQPPKNLKKISTSNSANSENIESDIKVGNKVEHSRFGIGEVLSIEGVGMNTKFTIKFAEDTKNLLLQYAKLKIVD